MSIIPDPVTEKLEKRGICVALGQTQIPCPRFIDLDWNFYIFPSIKMGNGSIAIYIYIRVLNISSFNDFENDKIADCNLRK